MIIQQVNNLLVHKSISVRQFARDLTHYLGEPDNFDNFYQRHANLLKGEYKTLREEEEHAYKNWLIIESNTHAIGKALSDLLQTHPEKKVEQARKWLSSGIFNPTKARRLTGKLKASLKQLQEFYK